MAPGLWSCLRESPRRIIPTMAMRSSTWTLVPWVKYCEQQMTEKGWLKIAFLYIIYLYTYFSILFGGGCHNIYIYMYYIYILWRYTDLSYGVGDIYQADIRRQDNLSSIERFHTNHRKRRHIREFSQNGRLDKYHWKRDIYCACKIQFTLIGYFETIWVNGWRFACEVKYQMEDWLCNRWWMTSSRAGWMSWWIGGIFVGLFTKKKWSVFKQTKSNEYILYL